jgi:hypothetical protein
MTSPGGHRSAFLTALLFLCIHGAGASSGVPSRGLLASYYFSGDCRNEAGGTEGFPAGASLSSDRFGNPNSAYCFRGPGDRIDLGAGSSLKREVMSISFWMKINAASTGSRSYPYIPVLSTRAVGAEESAPAYGVFLLKKNSRVLALCNSSHGRQAACISNEPAPVRDWHHVVFMFSGDSVYLYLNGVLGQKHPKNFSMGYLPGEPVIVGNPPGSSAVPGSPWLNGCVDDLKFFERLLTEAEISDLYNEPDRELVGELKEKAGKEFVISLFTEYWHVHLTFLAVASAAFGLVRTRRRSVQRREKEKTLLQQQLVQSEMRALRSQMNPHFIFNAINSIQHYVLTNEKELANKYLVKFSRLMRNVLELSKEELITLREELDTVQLYLEIEALRFNNAFVFSVSCDPSVDVQQVKLPPLLIQPFVENAIWHGLLLKEGSKELNIHVTRNDRGVVIIRVDDNGIGRETAGSFRNKELKRRSFGMEITQSRLKVLQTVHGLPIAFWVIDKRDEKGSKGTTVVIEIDPDRKTKI